MLRLVIVSVFFVGNFLFGSSSDEVILKVQKAIEREESFFEVEELLEDMPVEELKKLSATFEKGWLSLEKDYLQKYEAFVQSQFTGPARNERKKTVRELRAQFHEIRALSEEEMKPKLKEISMPALEGLRRILMPEALQLLETAPDELKEKHRLLHGMAKFRDLLQEYSVAVGAGDTPAQLQDAERSMVAKFQDLDRAGLRIMAENDKIAAKAKVPAAERRGVRELNEMRLLIGQNALVLDPKLCEAGRGHSQDMAERGFFAHQSPVPGKETPSDRARKAGTSGGGENIFMGSPEPEAANRGWFFSPGHHKNMFNSGYRTVGLGQFNSHWTQMFGG